MRNDTSLLSIVVGAKIRYYRSLYGKTQQELAALANISVSSIQRIEEGHYDNIAPLATLVDIANVLDLPIETFLTVTEEEVRLASARKSSKKAK